MLTNGCGVEGVFLQPSFPTAILFHWGTARHHLTPHKRDSEHIVYVTKLILSVFWLNLPLGRSWSQNENRLIQWILHILSPYENIAKPFPWPWKETVQIRGSKACILGVAYNLVLQTDWDQSLLPVKLSLFVFPRCICSPLESSV